MKFAEIYSILKDNKINTLLIDFDHTITTFDSQTTIGVFSKVLGHHYVEKKKKIDLKVSNCDNKFYLKYLWFKKILLLKKYHAKENINKVIKYFKINNQFINLFKYCYRHRINIIVCSSGYKPLIDEILKKAELKNIEVLANNNLFKIITPLNKNKYTNVKGKKPIVVGNDIADANMSKLKCPTIAICNDLYEYEKLEQYFNYVIIEDLVIIKKYKTSKSTIGICLHNKQKYFIKSINEDNNEIIKYRQLKDYFNISKIAIEYNKYIIYEYISDFESKTINDYLYCSNKSINIELLMNQYKKSLDDTLTIKEECECESAKYFIDRTYLVEDYINKLEYENVIINNKKYNIKNILNEIIINIKTQKRIYAFISQGDPTDTNITTTGFITDFENGGYNSLLSEFSIAFVSLFSHGRYFYPKYNKKAYVLNKNILNKIDKYKIDNNYLIKDRNIYVNNIDFKLPDKNRFLILNIIDLYINNSNYNKYSSNFLLVKYYICMRLLTPININSMNEYDKVTILVLVIYMYSNVVDLYSLKKIIW